MNIKLRQVDLKALSNKKFKGSVTVEAAFSFTLTAFIVFMMLGPLFIIKTSSDLLVELNDISKNRCNYELVKRGVSSTKIFEKISENIDEDGFIRSNLSKIEDVINYGLVLLNYNNHYSNKDIAYKNINFIYDKTGGNYNKETGIVRYDYLIDFNMPYNVLHIRNPQNRLVINRRSFIGSDGNRYNSDTTGGEYIYLADNYVSSHIYHTYIDCTYLVKHTYEYTLSEVQNQKNVSNQSYEKCDYCFKDVNTNNTTVCYVTEYGERFHYKDNCPLMTAYVTKVTKDYIDRYGLNLCSRCASKEKNND